MPIWIPSFINEYTFTGYEYVGENSKGEAIGYHNPEFAKQFEKKSDAKKWTKEEISDDCEFQAVKLSDHIKLFKEKLDNPIYRKLNRIDKRRNVEYDENKHSPLDVLNWWVESKKRYDEGVSQEVYESWPKLYSVFECIFGINLYRMGNYEDMISCIEMSVSPNTKYEKFLEEFNIIKDMGDKYDKYKLNDGTVVDCKVIDIFDHLLSEYGNYATFYYNLEKPIYIIESTDGIEEISSDLKDVFEVWKKYRYYD